MPDREAKKVDVKKTCFVVGPIGGDGTDTRDHADFLLEMIIKPTFDEHFSDFNVVRSDTISEPGMIDSQMINHLLDAELVIADMSERNPNAFYEMGIRHMTNLPIVHMFAVGTEIPFDVKPYRAIDFSIRNPASIFAAQRRLKEAVAATQNSDYAVVNPVTRARGVLNFHVESTPAMDLMKEELEELKRTMRTLVPHLAPPVYWDATHSSQVEDMAARVDAALHRVLRPTQIEFKVIDGLGRRVALNTALEIWAGMGGIAQPRYRLAEHSVFLTFDSTIPIDIIREFIDKLAKLPGISDIRLRST
ncbi:hypothetical protein [Rhizobium sp. Leaf453]|uniref:hypothetical protein n=1 Tax=Rhizobium sp. Leaf453 TaxID=1736380 RepID=UPI0007155976|nr:hypothetical protein [Rhizobium sp. Leaf453]KQT96963.1 hypothetical protein ASG68_08375 [Rhizobium sp. Leaf453]